jgi:hypothetical protein
MDLENVVSGFGLINNVINNVMHSLNYVQKYKYIKNIFTQYKYKYKYNAA